MSKELCPTLVFVILVAALIGFAERPEMTGHTELPEAVGWGGDNPGDNYAVFRQGRYIYLITKFMPAKIVERDGMIVRTNTVVNQRGLPVKTYSPAKPTEKALWYLHFP